MISTLLSFAPLILVTFVIIFAGILIIDDARRHWREPDTNSEHAKAKT
jgi:hypothetical protein